ncbi:protease propeptide/inhibitor [Ceratobasidium sp. AG-I]|nr:protease propeptide/inhibitor [Ceratobasidium sp. AG-I]
MPNKYIVVFKDGTPQSEIDKAATDVETAGGKVTHRYDTVLTGFAAEIPDAHLTSLQSFVGDKIDYIEPDGVATIQ